MAIPYYITGTATLTVGSVTMTGQGTLWQGWVRPGDVVYPKEGTPNVVETVNSNTQITLLFPYRGAAQVAQSYIIMRTPDDVFTQTLARDVLQKVNDSTLVALAGLAPAARKGFRLGPTMSAETFDLSDAALTLLDDGDIAAMRSTLGLARQASLADQTAGRLLEVGSFGLGKSLILVSPNLADVRASGTYYCNSPTGGPSGTTNGWLIVRDLDPDYASHQFIDVATGMYWENLRYAGAWRGWRRQMNEFGTNGNGSYLRFPDGTQMCWGTISTGVSANTQFTDTGQMPWAAAFSAIPRFFASALGNYGNQVLVASPIGTTASAYSVRMINAFAANNTAGTATAVALAIGRWF